MICYRDRSYCENQDECKTQECSRRLTDSEKERAKKLGLPVAWTPYREHCGKFEEVKK